MLSLKGSEETFLSPRQAKILYLLYGVDVRAVKFSSQDGLYLEIPKIYIEI